MAQLPYVGLYKPCIELPFGDCAMYFEHGVTAGSIYIPYSFFTPSNLIQSVADNSASRIPNLWSSSGTRDGMLIGLEYKTQRPWWKPRDL